MSGAELSGSAPVVLSCVRVVVGGRYTMYDQYMIIVWSVYDQLMITRPSQQTIMNITVMVLRVLSPCVPDGAVR